MKKFFMTVLALTVCAAMVFTSAFTDAETSAMPEASETPEKIAEEAEEEAVLTVTADGADGDAEGLAFVDDGTVWVSLRSVCAALGAEVTWDGKTMTATAKGAGITLTYTVGDEYVTANGRYLYTAGGCPIVDGRIMVPADILARSFGAEMTWDAEEMTLALTSGGEPILSGDKFYDSDDVYWLSRIIHAEARGEPFEGQIAVGNVVINRTDPAIKEFPNNIKAVIFDRRCGIQFSPAYSGAIYNRPQKSCIVAAKIALEGTDIVGNSLYFSPTYKATTCWASKHCRVVTTIQNHIFFEY